jgi:hypothetical protein
MPLVGFEPTISAGERPQTYVLDRTATGIGIHYLSHQKVSGKFSGSESTATNATTGTMVTKLTVLTLVTKVVVNTRVMSHSDCYLCPILTAIGKC